MTDPNDSSVDRIRKLLAMAERGATEAERDAFNSKATALMLEHAIDMAMLQDDSRAEAIIRKTITLACPKSYSFEYCLVGNAVAESLNCKTFVVKSNGRELLTIIGYQSDVDSVIQLTTSLVAQCTLALGPWFTNTARYWWNGTDKYNAKRGFITGFARGIRDKMRMWIKETVATHGAELVLVTRVAQVDSWISDNVKIGSTRGRSYETGAVGAGRAAGQAADVGGARIGGVHKAIGG